MAAVASVAAQDTYTTTALDAYAKGVNAWITQVNAGALGRGAPEFFMFSPEIAFWQPADSLAIGKLMAPQLGSAVEHEVLRARVSLVLGAAAAGQVPMPIGAAARESISLARARGWGKQDFSALLDALCETSGIDQVRFKDQQE